MLNSIQKWKGNRRRQHCGHSVNPKVWGWESEWCNEEHRGTRSDCRPANEPGHMTLCSHVPAAMYGAIHVSDRCGTNVNHKSDIHTVRHFARKLIPRPTCFLLHYIYRVIRNDCRGFNNLSYTIHLRYDYMYFLFNRTTLQVFVTYLTGALYVHHLW